MNKVTSSHTAKHLSESLRSSSPLTESPPLLLGIAPSRKKRDNTHVGVVIKNLGAELMLYSIISVDGRDNVVRKPLAFSAMKSYLKEKFF